MIDNWFCFLLRQIGFFELLNLLSVDSGDSSQDFLSRGRVKGDPESSIFIIFVKIHAWQIRLKQRAVTIQIHTYYPGSTNTHTLNKLGRTWIQTQHFLLDLDRLWYQTALSCGRTIYFVYFLLIWGFESELVLFHVDCENKQMCLPFYSNHPSLLESNHRAVIN